MNRDSLRFRVEKLAFEKLMNLRPSWQRRLAGRPIVRDGQTLATETQLMLRLNELARLGDPSTLPLNEGRAALLRQALIGGGQQKRGSARSLTVAGRPARLYIPNGAAAIGPLLVFFHGGGFVYGDLRSHEASCRYVADRAGVRVLSVDYRLAPEEPFPAAYDDAVAAFDWVHEHAEEIGADTSRIGVAGDSAGGNLAAGVALVAREKCAFQLLIYPVVDMDARTESRTMFNEGFYLTQSFLDVAESSYIRTGTDKRDPRLSPLYAQVPAGVAPAYVVTAGFDPLRDEGEAYARKLEDAGVKVELRRFPDQIHGFFNVIGAGRTSKAAVDVIADALKAGL
ncbi:MAG: alpha/beta hydrolase [Nocardioides sp.]